MAKLIAIEHIDGAGGTTQLHRLEEELTKRGFRVKTHAFPTRDRDWSISVMIDSALSNKEVISKYTLQLLFEADRMEMQSQIKQWLREYDIVLLDRYTMSGLAYGIANMLPEAWCRSLQTPMIKAHNLFIDVHPNLAIHRKKQSVQSTYDADPVFLQRVREIFLHLIPIGQRVNGDQEVHMVTNDLLLLVMKAPEAVVK